MSQGNQFLAITLEKLLSDTHVRRFSKDIYLVKRAAYFTFKVFVLIQLTLVRKVMLCFKYVLYKPSFNFRFLLYLNKYKGEIELWVKLE